MCVLKEKLFLHEKNKDIFVQNKYFFFFGKKKGRMLDL